MFYFGIDISKRNHEASLIDSTGKLLGKALKFPNSQAGGHKLLQWLTSHVPFSGDVFVGMEATGHYWLALHSFLCKQGYTIDILNPIQDAIRNLYIRQTTTDSKVLLETGQKCH